MISLVIFTEQSIEDGNLMLIEIRILISVKDHVFHENVKTLIRPSHTIFDPNNC